MLFRSQVPPAAATRQDVIDCYQAILGRSPESEASVTSHLQLRDYRAVVRTFLSSPEFKARVAPARPVPAAPLRPFFRMGEACNQIETSVTDADLGRCLARVKAAWSALGETRPHHSVLTEDQFLPEALEGNLAAFWKTGEREVSDLLAVIGRYLAKGTAQAEVNELGCGVGRVTIPFAGHFAQVNGYDISRPHLDIAQRFAAERGAHNVRLHEVAIGGLPSFQPCDVFYTRIVLQHNPPPVIMQMIRAILASLRAGGVAIFQVPTFIQGYRFDLGPWLDRPLTTDMEMHAVPMSAVFAEIARQNCAVREVREDDSTGSARMISTTFVAQKS